jgi:hypothetical protein
MSPVRFERRTAVDAGLHLTKYNQPFGVLSHNEIRHLFDMKRDGCDQRDAGVPGLDA